MMSKDYSEGNEAGLNAGYDDANYAGAYGGRINNITSYLRRYGSGHSDDFCSGFMTGHEEGVERYLAGLFADGSPIPD